MTLSIKPNDIINTTKIIGLGLQRDKISNRDKIIQPIICETVLLPLSVNQELRSGLADLADDEDYGRADRKVAFDWIRKILGIDLL